MGLMTIGAFARASRLSPKALRLYDELGLLPPAHVDPVSGYRYYEPEQLERARLVVWLRRLGMPLARIRVVCGLEPGAAADEVAAYWTQVEADIATRRDLVTAVIDHLSKGTTSDARRIRGLRCAARSDIGLVRERNEDAAFAGERLFAVADGFGAAGGGDLASVAAVDALRPLDAEIPPGDLLGAFLTAAHLANETLRGIVESDPSLEGLGTTLTAMLWSGSRLALAHIGDSRAYLRRDGELFQLTRDHTYVQSLLDEGHISAAEAASHPRRSLLLRALDGGEIDPDLQLRATRAGDRYLLCSDGLSAVVVPQTIREVLDVAADPGQAVEDLVDLANRGGGPDNVACVVADVMAP